MNLEKLKNNLLQNKYYENFAIFNYVDSNSRFLVEEYVLGINTLVSTPYFQILLCTYKDDLCLGMSTVYKNNEVLKNFCRWFTDQGIEITMNVSEEK